MRGQRQTSLLSRRRRAAQPSTPVRVPDRTLPPVAAHVPGGTRSRRDSATTDFRRVFEAALDPSDESRDVGKACFKGLFTT